MYRRLSGVLFPVMTILLIGALVWGYQENRDKNSVLLKAENQYQRAFHDLSYHVDRIHGEIGNTLAVNSDSTQMHRKGLMNVWRITSEAQGEINQLPLTLLPFNQTEELLSRVSQFSYQTAARDLTKSPLSDKELSNLKELYKRTGEISNNLQQVQNKVISNRLRWMDVESALATEKAAADNTIIDGFKTVDKKVSEYSELDLGPSVASVYKKRSVKQLDSKPVSQNEIRDKAAKFLGVSTSNIKVAENGTGTEWASYTATATGVGQDSRAVASLDFTQRGGNMISYNLSRDVGPRTISAGAARQKAGEFLKSKGFEEMTPVTYDEYDNMGSLTFVRSQDGVLIYPEKATVRVALDTGEVTGVQCSDYVYERNKDDKEQLPKAKMTLAEVKKHLNPEFKENYHRMAVIDNDAGERVATYEFSGRINGSNYRIYLNGNTGEEEKVEEFHQAGTSRS
ncbi:germination protein YpeB [Paenibacillus yonginensis]|uniref:Germination protein YpeB n=1 Tax=Paenibacillus yonginensis TaxID=1462996 RepID=A0A1B1N0B5_9BACL|nr:germination protein YpeB [Paenibacillus yonginensis]ANS74880.1 germination protein YpeB [Paenibacillus yonginensis]